MFLTYINIVIVVKGELAVYNVTIILILVFMALLSHFRTMCGDPGAVPYNAYPLERHENERTQALGSIAMCGRCDAYKPPGSHHDRVSNRCVCRMDHFCPWMNNAIGAKNQKNFFLFLIYTDIAAIYMYVILALHMIDCGAFACFNGVELNLVRVLIFVLLFAILFTSSMILNQIYGLSTGLGTIDRMKLKSDDPEEGTPVPFEHVFGSYILAWFLPLDPIFEDEDEVYKYCVKPGLGSYAVHLSNANNRQL